MKNFKYIFKDVVDGPGWTDGYNEGLNQKNSSSKAKSSNDCSPQSNKIDSKDLSNLSV